MGDLVPVPGTEILPPGWWESVVMPWADRQGEDRKLAEAEATLAGFEAAWRQMDKDTLEITRARRYLEIRRGELLGSPEQTWTGKPSTSLGSEVLQKDLRMRFRRLAARKLNAVEHLREATDADDLTRAALLRAIYRPPPQPVAEPVPLPAGTFRCIVADPPWPMQNIEREQRDLQSGQLDYPVMELDDIAKLPVAEHAADDCHLYLWVTHKFLPAGLSILGAWGFNYQCVMTWRKNVGITPFSWMYDTEHVLFARRGNLPLTQLGLRLSFDAPVRGHSVKPDVFYERVCAASPEPRLEMFARRERDGFTAWGNEVAGAS